MWCVLLAAMVALGRVRREIAPVGNSLEYIQCWGRRACATRGMPHSLACFNATQQLVLSSQAAAPTPHDGQRGPLPGPRDAFAKAIDKGPAGTRSFAQDRRRPSRPRRGRHEHEGEHGRFDGTGTVGHVLSLCAARGTAQARNLAQGHPPRVRPAGRRDAQDALQGV